MRFRWMTSLVFAVLISLGTLATAAEKPLALGEAAPKLDIKEFVKGEPVKQFAKDKVYVVEFWATWCGPCIATIPHLTELQKKYTDVVFIGVSIDEDVEEVKSFVKGMGDKMDYRVGIDTRTKEVADGLMAKSWLAAALQSGIPAAFIVNQEGKVAWIGHPAEIDEPLEQVTSGKWDLVAEAKKYQELIAARLLAATLETDFTTAVNEKKYQQALDLVDKAIEKNPELEPDWAVAKFWTMILLKKSADAAVYGKRLVGEMFSEEPDHLMLIAGIIVRPKEFAPFGADDLEAEPAKATDKPGSSAKPDAKKPDAKGNTAKAAENFGLKAKTEHGLIVVAIDAAEKAIELTSESTDVTSRTSLVEILAEAYVLGGVKSKAVALLQAQLEALQEQADAVKTATSVLKAQLKDIGGGSDDKSSKEESDTPTKK